MEKMWEGVQRRCSSQSSLTSFPDFQLLKEESDNFWRSTVQLTIPHFFPEISFLQGSHYEEVWSTCKPDPSLCAPSALLLPSACTLYTSSLTMLNTQMNSLPENDHYFLWHEFNQKRDELIYFIIIWKQKKWYTGRRVSCRCRSTSPYLLDELVYTDQYYP